MDFSPNYCAKFLDPSRPFPVGITFDTGASTSQPFHPPTKKGKGVGKTSKKMKKHGPNLTGVPTDSATDANRDAILIESGMEPGTSTAGDFFDMLQETHTASYF